MRYLKAVSTALLVAACPWLAQAQQRGTPAAGEQEPAVAQDDWQALLDLPPDEVPTHLVKILRTSNKAQVNRYVGKVYDFKNVNPGQVNNFFHSALFREEGAAYTFLGPDGKSGKLLVICPAYQIEYFDQLARDLDRTDLTSSPGSRYVYKQLNHRSAADPDFINIARQYGTVNTVVVGDVPTNAIFTFDAPSGSDYLVTNLESFLDTPTPVVKTRVKIFEVDVNNDGTLGLDYEDYKNGPYQNMLVGVVNYGKLNANSTVDTSGADPVTADTQVRSKTNASLVDLQYPSAFFDFLVQKGKARIVTETQLTTSSRRSALLFAGDQILYYEVASDPDSFSRTVTGEAEDMEIPVEVAPKFHNAAGVLVEALDAGVRVVLTPVIGTNDVEMDVDAAVVSLRGFTDDGSPLLNSRRASTKLSIPDGEEVVLGGLIREQQARRSYKVPVLGSLPVLGWLFGGETNNVQRSMIVMVIQPEIDTTFTNVTAEDNAAIAEIVGDTSPTIPEAAYGFDMFLLDSEAEK